MRKLVLIFLFAFISNCLYSQLGFNGHIPATTIPYNASPYTYNPKMLQLAGSGTASNKIFSGYSADNFVNFNFDTGGKNVYLVYTTDGSNPNKTNGTPIVCGFSTYNNPDRLWLCNIPASANTTGTTVKYIFYISNSDLASSWGRVDGQGGNQYLTSWTESSVQPYQYTVIDAALPVKLTSFTANTENSLVHLNWETAVEENNDYFEVQRSVNAKNFETIGKVNGNSSTLTSHLYHFTDIDAQNGVNYYRLKQVDYDKKQEFSRIISVSVVNENKFDFTIFPNPSNEIIVIKNLKVGNTVELFSSFNRLEKSAMATSDMVEFNIHNLSAGMYIIRVKQQNGSVATKKLVIE